MEKKAVKLEDDSLDNVNGGVANGRLPMTDKTCPKCGFGKAWFRTTWYGKTMYSCVKCEHEWYA